MFLFLLSIFSFDRATRLYVARTLVSVSMGLRPTENHESPLRSQRIFNSLRWAFDAAASRLVSTLFAGCTIYQGDPSDFGAPGIETSLDAAA